jgi:hypothetical protein
VSDITGLERCEVCGDTTSDGDLFGYLMDRCSRWYCDTHRPRQFYADRRLPALNNPNDEREEVYP